MITLSCQNCGGTIARDLEVLASSPTEITLRFALKCPHCQVPNRVEFRTELKKTISINGKVLEDGKGESRVRTLSG